MSTRTPCYRLELDVDDLEATATLYGPTGRTVSAVLTDGESCTSAMVPVSELIAAAWIPVERELPEPREDVLIAIEDDETGEHVVESGWLNRHRRWQLLSSEHTLIYGGRRVTHWMPWPAHPSAVGQEQVPANVTTSAPEGC